MASVHHALIVILLLFLPAAAFVQDGDALRVDVNLVSIFLTAQDQAGQYVTGLSAQDFRVFEDGVEQNIEVFEKEDQVESAIGILIDNSGSVTDTLPMMKLGVLDFARKEDFDELFVMTFGTSARVLHDVGQPIRTLESRLETVRPRGTSVLFDAMLEGIRKLEQSEHARKALIVFTDGQDNGSVKGFRDVLLASQRSGVLLYFIPIGARVLVDENTVEDLSRDSGGRVIYLSKTDAVPPALEGIRRELAMQYYLGYYAARTPGFHQIRVEVPGRDLKIRAKAGYLGG